jgi:hypothetical protein
VIGPCSELGAEQGFGATVQLSDLYGSNGFALNGIDRDHLAGSRFSGAGDINNDGFDDLIIGAYMAALI